jgi:hypothetical protein
MVDIDEGVDIVISRLERLVEECKDFQTQPWYKDLNEALRYTRMAKYYIKKRFIK